MPSLPGNSARAPLRLIHGGAEPAASSADAARAHTAEEAQSAEPEAPRIQRSASENAEERGASAKTQRGASAPGRGRSGAAQRRKRGARALRRGALARRGAGLARRGMGAMRRGMLRLAPAAGEPTSWIGRDFGEPRAQRTLRQRRWPGVLAGLVIAGLLLAGLRMTIVRERYLLGEAIQVETALRQRERAASVAVRELRDPRRLRRLALQAGFARPERAIELDPPAEILGSSGGERTADASRAGRPNRGGNRADDTTGLGRRVEWSGR